MSRSFVLASVAALALGLAGCAETPTTPSGPTPASLDEREQPRRGAEARRQRQAPLLQRMLDQSLRRLAAEQGREAAAARSAELRRLRGAVRTAAEARDRDAMRAASAALQLEMATIVVDVQGAQVVERVLGAGEQRLARLAERLASARAEGRDVARAEQRLERLREVHAEATAALAAGNAAEALVGAARVVSSAERGAGGRGPGQRGGARDRAR